MQSNSGRGRFIENLSAKHLPFKINPLPHRRLPLQSLFNPSLFNDVAFWAATYAISWQSVATNPQPVFFLLTQKEASHVKSCKAHRFLLGAGSRPGIRN